MKTSPLNNIKVASPCSANWDEMLGDDRKRYCGDCKLNVFNLSGMTKIEAEDLLTNSEGRVCVRFYRRSDGTVLTQDCPVGWAKVKRNLSRAATAVFTLIVGLFGGIFAFNLNKKTQIEVGQTLPANVNIKVEDEGSTCSRPNPENVTMGKVATMGTPVPIKVEKDVMVDGQISNIEEIRTQLKKNKANR